MSLKSDISTGGSPIQYGATALRLGKYAFWTASGAVLLLVMGRLIVHPVLNKRITHRAHSDAAFLARPGETPVRPRPREYQAIESRQALDCPTDRNGQEYGAHQYDPLDEGVGVLR
jgi:hypothetical protein